MNTTLHFGRFTLQLQPGNVWAVSDGGSTWIRDSFERAVGLVQWLRG